MRNKWLLLGLLAGSIVVLDQASKYWVVRELTTQMDGATTLGERLKAMYASPPPSDSGNSRHFGWKRAITVLPRFFRLNYWENSGAAWGMFQTLPERIRIPFFHLVSIGAVVLIGTYFGRLTGQRSERWAYFGLPMVLGGALGNYVDRATRGFVVDFLEAHWMDKASWPSFNVADSCICIGVGMLLIDALVRKEPKSTLTSKTSKA